MDWRDTTCGPYTCEFPPPDTYNANAVWVCPHCGTNYRKDKPRRVRPWRNWHAPHGSWVLTLRQSHLSVKECMTLRDAAAVLERHSTRAGAVILACALRKLASRPEPPIDQE